MPAAASTTSRSAEAARPARPPAASAASRPTPRRPMARARRVRARHGASAYPGSPSIARRCCGRRTGSCSTSCTRPSMPRSSGRWRSRGAAGRDPPPGRLRGDPRARAARAAPRARPRRPVLRGEDTSTPPPPPSFAGCFARWPEAVVLVWYPLLAAGRHAELVAGSARAQGPARRGRDRGRHDRHDRLGAPARQRAPRRGPGAGGAPCPGGRSPCAACRQPSREAVPPLSQPIGRVPDRGEGASAPSPRPRRRAGRIAATRLTSRRSINHSRNGLAEARRSA
jgi:hypothetical protein